MDCKLNSRLQRSLAHESGHKKTRGSLKILCGYFSGAKISTDAQDMSMQGKSLPLASGTKGGPLLL